MSVSAPADVGPVDISRLFEGDEVFELMAEYMVQSLTRVRDTLDSFIKCTEGAEKAKAEEVKKQVEDFLEQLQQSKKLSGLQKFFKALGIFGFIIALIAAVLCPTPMTIGLFIAAAVMFLEPLLAEATGNESMIGKGMSAMFEAMSDKLGIAGAAAIGAVMMVVLSLVLAGAGAGAAASIMSGLSASTQSLRAFVSDFLANFMKFFSGQLTQTQSTALRQFLEYTQAAILMAQSGVQISMATLQLHVAELMKSYEISQAVIDQWTSLIEQINGDTNFYQDALGGLEDLLSRMFNKSGVQA